MLMIKKNSSYLNAGGKEFIELVKMVSFFKCEALGFLQLFHSQGILI